MSTGLFAGGRARQYSPLRQLPRAMRRCIYCLEAKEEPKFDTEHVIPRAFGSFDSDTLVIDCVCKDCNGFLGRTIDEKLGRDTIEGIDRVRVGLKKAADFKTLGRRSTTHVEFDKGGPMKGARGHHVPDPSGEGLAVSPLPQVGFGRSSDGPFEWFPLHELPSKDDLIASGYERGTEVFMQTWGAPVDECLAALKAKGFSGAKIESQVLPPPGRTRVEVVSRISHPEFRAASKIALNYLAAMQGASFVLLPQFNEIRRYVREGVLVRDHLVEPALDTWLVQHKGTGNVAVGHYVAVVTRNQRIEADVSLLGRIRYRVLLADGGFVMPVTIRSAHFFDVEGRQIEAVPDEAIRHLLGG